MSTRTQGHPSSDAKDARWVPLDQVSAVESDASVMRAVDRIRAWRAPG